MDTTGASTGDVATKTASGVEWQAIPAVADVDDITNVSAGSPNDDDVLTYDSGSGDWQAGQLPIASIDTTGGSNGDALTIDGSGNPTWSAGGGGGASNLAGLSDVSSAPTTANVILATPDGSTGNYSGRALVAADIPNLTLGKITDKWHLGSRG